MANHYCTESPLYSVDTIANIRSKVRGFMGSSEQSQFMYHLAQTSKCAAEIGSYCGLSSAIVGSGMKDNGTYYCIDTFEASNKELEREDTYAIWAANMALFDLQKTCVPVKGWSYERQVLEQIPENLDFVYVDGDHETNSVLLDALLYRQKLKPSGLLLFHDVTWSSVHTAATELVSGDYMQLVFQIDDFGVYRTSSKASDATLIRDLMPRS